MFLEITNKKISILYREILKIFDIYIYKEIKLDILVEIVDTIYLFLNPAIVTTFIFTLPQNIEKLY